MPQAKNIYPVIVPVDYLRTGWQLPHHKFPNKEFVLTWVTFEGSSPMVYMTEMEVRGLNDYFGGWQQQSFRNLLRHSGDLFHTHARYRDDTDHLIYLGFMNDDGIGSSRILLNHELTKAFPKGYYLALPDRSCGLVISKDITEQELNEIELMVKGMHNNATTPMTGEIFNPGEFALPFEWTYPVPFEEESQPVVVRFWRSLIATFR